MTTQLKLPGGHSAGQKDHGEKELEMQKLTGSLLDAANKTREAEDQVRRYKLILAMAIIGLTGMTLILTARAQNPVTQIHHRMFRLRAPVFPADAPALQHR